MRRAGDVIPQIVKVLDDRRGSELPNVVFPDVCPDCNVTLTRDLDEVAIRCENSLACPAQQKAAFEHFVSRKAMDIDGVGKSGCISYLIKAWC